MAYDPERAALVTQAFRYKVISDNAVIAAYPNSKIIEINTNLDEAGATALANEIFNASGKSARTFTVTVMGALTLEDFINGAPRYYVRFTRHEDADASKIYSVIGAKIRPVQDQTELTVRG